MSRRTILIPLAFVGLICTAAVGWTATRAELASGSGKNGNWRVVASWDFGHYCLKRSYANGEGGGCGFAEPGTINESISWRLSRGDRFVTVVAGPVPPGATQVEITPGEGDPVSAELTKVVGMTFYVVELPGVQGIDDIRALDDRGQVVEEYQHGSLPLPNP